MQEIMKTCVSVFRLR